MDEIRQIKAKIEQLKALREGYIADKNYYLKDGLTTKALKKSEKYQKLIADTTQEIHNLLKKMRGMLK